MLPRPERYERSGVDGLLARGLENMDADRELGADRKPVQLVRVFDLFVSATRLEPWLRELSTDLGRTIRTADYHRHIKPRRRTSSPATPCFTQGRAALPMGWRGLRSRSRFWWGSWRRRRFVVSFSDGSIGTAAAVTSAGDRSASAYRPAWACRAAVWSGADTQPPADSRRASRSRANPYASSLSSRSCSSATAYSSTWMISDPEIHRPRLPSTGLVRARVSGSTCHCSARNRSPPWGPYAAKLFTPSRP